MENQEKSQIKNNFKKLSLFNLSDFYTVTATNYNIKLQGDFNSSLIKKIKLSKKWSESISENGYIEFKRSNIEIVLT